MKTLLLLSTGLALLFAPFTHAGEVAAKTSNFTWNAASPAKFTYGTPSEALAAARFYASVTNGTVIVTSGTPSMEPLIHGRAYVVIRRQPYESISDRDLLVYLGRPNASRPDRFTMLHRAVYHDRDGWIMSGDNNRWSENWDRVTPNTYVGSVVALFEVGV